MATQRVVSLRNKKKYFDLYRNFNVGPQLTDYMVNTKSKDTTQVDKQPDEPQDDDTDDEDADTPDEDADTQDEDTDGEIKTDGKRKIKKSPFVGSLGTRVAGFVTYKTAQRLNNVMLHNINKSKTELNHLQAAKDLAVRKWTAKGYKKATLTDNARLYDTELADVQRNLDTVATNNEWKILPEHTTADFATFENAKTKELNIAFHDYREGYYEPTLHYPSQNSNKFFNSFNIGRSVVDDSTQARRGAQQVERLSELKKVAQTPKNQLVQEMLAASRAGRPATPQQLEAAGLSRSARSLQAIENVSPAESYPSTLSSQSFLSPVRTNLDTRLAQAAPQQALNQRVLRSGTRIPSSAAPQRGEMLERFLQDTAEEPLVSSRTTFADFSPRSADFRATFATLNKQIAEIHTHIDKTIGPNSEFQTRMNLLKTKPYPKPYYNYLPEPTGSSTFVPRVKYPSGPISAGASTSRIVPKPTTFPTTFTEPPLTTSTRIRVPTSSSVRVRPPTSRIVPTVQSTQSSTFARNMPSSLESASASSTRTISRFTPELIKAENVASTPFAARMMQAGNRPLHSPQLRAMYNKAYNSPEAFKQAYNRMHEILGTKLTENVGSRNTQVIKNMNMFDGELQAESQTVFSNLMQNPYFKNKYKNYKFNLISNNEEGASRLARAMRNVTKLYRKVPKRLPTKASAYAFDSAEAVATMSRLRALGGMLSKAGKAVPYVGAALQLAQLGYAGYDGFNMIRDHVSAEDFANQIQDDVGLGFLPAVGTDVTDNGAFGKWGIATTVVMPVLGMQLMAADALDKATDRAASKFLIQEGKDLGKVFNQVVDHPVTSAKQAAEAVGDVVTHPVKSAVSAAKTIGRQIHYWTGLGRHPKHHHTETELRLTQNNEIDIAADNVEVAPVVEVAPENVEVSK